MACGVTIARAKGDDRSVNQSSEEIREALDSIRRRVVGDIVHASPLRRRRSRRERVAAFLARGLNQRIKRRGQA
jgi:hypothetical protein